MAEITADFIEERNKKFLESLQGNVGKYLSFVPVNNGKIPQI